jgi:Uma2 family endonuclease
MATATQRATLDDLYRFPGKAELINGRIVPLMATGRRPNRVASRIFRSLDDYAQAQGSGEAYTDNMGFAVPKLPSGRESFNPDASYYNGPFPADNMRFIQGPPTFAVEVRSQFDYGDAADAELAAKLADYFAAGTLIVWDVDPVADTIACYRAATPTQATVFRRGDVADAEPAVPGWRIDVSTIFA